VSDETSTNEAKYATGNPVVQRMLGGFFAELRETVAPLAPRSVLDAGCGEGEALARLGDLLPDQVSAIDVEQRCVDLTSVRHPAASVSRRSVLDLGFADDSFELVLCLEVLEHLDDPTAAVCELARVSARDVVVSVPYEPWFRLGSLLRGNYVGSLGNHPEHVNHFNRRSLHELLEPVLEVDRIATVFPWLIAAGRVR